MYICRRSRLIIIAIIVTISISTLFIIYGHLQSMAESEYDENQFTPLFLRYQITYEKIINSIPSTEFTY